MVGTISEVGDQHADKGKRCHRNFHLQLLTQVSLPRGELLYGSVLAVCPPPAGVSKNTKSL